MYALIVQPHTSDVNGYGPALSYGLLLGRSVYSEADGLRGFRDCAGFGLAELLDTISQREPFHVNQPPDDLDDRSSRARVPQQDRPFFECPKNHPENERPTVAAIHKNCDESPDDHLGRKRSIREIQHPAAQQDGNYEAKDAKQRADSASRLPDFERGILIDLFR